MKRKYVTSKDLRLRRARKFGSTCEKTENRVSVTGLASPTFEKDCTKFYERSTRIWG
jgi:hypothetical protein